MTELLGKTFGKYTVISSEPIPNLKYVKWKCKCECGRVKDLYQSKLLLGKYNKGCGCWAFLRHGESRCTTHGLTNTPVHSVWQYLVSRHRKYSKTNPSVALPIEWIFSFDRFMSDTKRKKSTDKFLARRDDSLPYSAENCYWTSAKPKSVKVRV